jgi:Spy/CpxP family protein refolding chaperone
MKKLFVWSVMLVVATVSLATAQQPQQRQRQTAEERAKSQTERLDKLVTLTADQKTKIEAISLDLAKQMDTKMQSNQGNRDAMRTAMQELDKTRDTKYKEVLNDEQFKKYSDDKEQRRKEMENRRRQRN